jgi:hypothetical protein
MHKQEFDSFIQHARAGFEEDNIEQRGEKISICPVLKGFYYQSLLFSIQY